MQQIVIEPWLPLVNKPSRYINHELNAVHKPWQRVNFCFAFPDVYEVGISHLGLKILYSIINRLPDCMADRCYLPWLDMSEIMRREGIPLWGSESRIPLSGFDCIGITLQSELTFTNVLETLDLARIPVYSKDRIETAPIIIAGGPCATNPLPLAPFIDVFFIGEAEEGITEIAQIFLLYQNRNERLAKLAELESCFVPALHLDLLSRGWKVKARKYAGFSAGTATHSPQLLSWQLATHNRCVAEIMRGCSRGCRFCQAGYFYRPVRERASTDILQDLLKEIELSGWDEAGLLSLSSSDYSCIKDLLFQLLNSVDTDKTHISLPSLRVDSLDDEMVELMRKLGREGLTIAPEAGSERLRNVINKNLSEAQILAGVKTAVELGWQRVKLYFMIGLPTETEEDIDGIIELIGKIAATGGKRLQINVTLSPFVPKPFTPFQWAPMLAADVLLQRCYRVKQAFYRKNQIKIKYHTIENSLLEAVLTRGDLAAAKLLHQAWELGARFDGWNECFDFSLWKSAAELCGIDIASYLEGRPLNEPLPWNFVDLGICTKFLRNEWDKATTAESTPDCRELCAACGICDELVHTVSAIPVTGPVQRNDIAPKAPTFLPNAKQYRYRVFYAKKGVLRFISHLDWMRMLFRLIGKAPLDTVFTQGFSPHPKVSLCPPLPLGVDGMCEFFDISFFKTHPHEELADALSQGMIPEFLILSSHEHTLQTQVPTGEWIRISLPDAWQEQAKKELAAFAQETEHVFTKSTDSRSKSYDLKQIIHSANWNAGELEIRKSLASPALYDVLAELLKLDKPPLYNCTVTRWDWVF